MSIAVCGYAPVGVIQDPFEHDAMTLLIPRQMGDNGSPQIMWSEQLQAERRRGATYGVAEIVWRDRS
jgi:hypothetical protein